MLEEGFKINYKDEVPLAHYGEKYAALDPDEAAARCGVSRDAEGRFRLRYMGMDLAASWPEFGARDGATGEEITRAAEKILILRYLCEGKHGLSTGKQLAYAEMPWGNVYIRQFTGRCLLRAARTFGGDLAAFDEAMRNFPGAVQVQSGSGKTGWKFEFLSGLFMSILLWEGDEEFPASCQMLFDDNFPQAFTAEDVAAVGECAISRIKAKLPAKNG
jgi:hypothetical protein